MEYIEREAALALVHEIHIPEVDYRHRCIDPGAIMDIPAADVAPVRHGRWINRGWSTVCSECGDDYAFAKRNYCPNCGAKMDGGET